MIKRDGDLQKKMYKDERDEEGRQKIGFKKEIFEEKPKEGIVIAVNKDLEIRNVVKDQGSGGVKRASWGSKK